MATQRAVEEQAKRVKVVQDADQVIEVEILAEAIRKIGKAADDMKKAGLSERAIILLLSEASGENRSTVKNVLNGMRDLRKMFLS